MSFFTRVRNHSVSQSFFGYVVATCFCLLTGVACALASPLPDGPTMKDVHDVINGRTYLLPQDDTGLLVASYPVPGNPNVLTQFFPFLSSNSTVTQQAPIDLHNNDFPTGTYYSSSSVVSSAASGRMFNNGNDVVISLITWLNPYTFQPTWAYNYYNPATQSNQGPYVLASALEPNSSQIASRVIMGDFQGDHLSSALLYVETDFGNYTLWGMNIVAPPNINQVDVIDPYGGGPQYSLDATNPSMRPIPSTIVAGDFNDDGIDEIAALMSDGQTIQLYQVNPVSKQITPYQTFMLPMSLNPAALSAGRFGLDPKIVLAAVGQQSGTANLFAFYIDPRLPQPVQKTNALPQASDYFSGVQVSGILAHAAPVIQPFSNVSEQLILGLQFAPPHRHNTGFIWFGTFDSTYTYNLQGSSDIIQESGCLLDMKVGNYNNIGTSGLSPAFQVSVLENYGSGGDYCTPPYQGGYLFIDIFNINVPSDFVNNPTSPAGPNGPGDWAQQVSYTEPNIGPYSNLQGVSFLTGDLQGRSLRLGSPEKITLQNHIQPDLVLGMPPMHVDWVNPGILGSNNCEPNTQGPSSPACILNLTVKPYGVSSDQTLGFNSSYKFSDGQTVSSSRKSSTSWGLSAKVTVGASFKYSIPGESSASASITSTTSNTYQNVQSTYNNQYNGVSGVLTAQTVFDDVLLFTSENQNIYNYPVLGQTDSNGNPIYISFSVPSSVQSIQMPGSTEEWYQPIHEPGNVLSYPSDWAMIQQEHTTGTANQLAASNCLAVGSATASNDVSWTQGSGSSQSSGWSDSVSSDLNTSFSYSAGGVIFDAGVEGKLSGSVDIGGSGSWSTLNLSSTSVTSGQAVNFTVPQFDNAFASEFAYAFQSYVFGVSNPAAGQAGLQPDGTYQGGINLFSAQPQITATGPLFVEYAANPTAGGPGLSCGQPGAAWWSNSYTLPDVGFNHPIRWDVSTANLASFINAQPPSANSPLLDQHFYQMKGFWITRQGQPGDPANVGSTIGEAISGDQLTLTARVYNFSLVATNGIVPNSNVHVRFYGQKICNTVNYSDGPVTDVCPDGAFLIPSTGRDGDFIISSIPGFNQGTSPNYALASVPFDTTGYDASELVFWAVTWLEDSYGNILPEVPDHGVYATSFVGRNFANMSDVPLLTHSNNVGLYGSFSPFYVAPAGASAADLEGAHASPLKYIDLRLPAHELVFDERAKVSVTFQAGQQFPGSHVAYYDGNPADGGKLFDYQHVHRLAPGEAATSRVFYRPGSCGVHTLYAVSDVEGSPATIGKITARVTIHPVIVISRMIGYLEELSMNRSLQKTLLALLRSSEERFREGEIARGLAALRVFRETAVSFPEGKGSRLRGQIEVLLTEAQNIDSCELILAGGAPPSASTLSANSMLVSGN